MHKSKKTLRICFFIVLVAVIAGGVWYYTQTIERNDFVSEGTLISKTFLRGVSLWR